MKEFIVLFVAVGIYVAALVGHYIWKNDPNQIALMSEIEQSQERTQSAIRSLRFQIRAMAIWPDSHLAIFRTENKEFK